MVIFQPIHPQFTQDMAGFLPYIFDEDDPRPAKEQANENYVAGWNPFNGFTLDDLSGELTYPGDPPMLPLAVAALRSEHIYLYPHAWVLIKQPDKSYEVSRMD